jgi:hypothetical protein
VGEGPPRGVRPPLHAVGPDADVTAETLDDEELSEGRVPTAVRERDEARGG